MQQKKRELEAKAEVCAYRDPSEGEIPGLQSEEGKPKSTVRATRRYGLRAVKCLPWEADHSPPRIGNL